MRLSIRRLVRQPSAVALVLGVATIFTLYAFSRRSQDPDSYICKVVSNSSRVDFTAISQLKTPGGVPMILHFVYKDTNILEAYRSNMETCIALNSNWTVMLWTDDSMRNFIDLGYPQYRTTFYGFPHKIQRADAIRYLILYTFGGVYLDLDMACRQPLFVSLSHIPCFLDKEREHQTQFLYGRQFSTMNSAMGCVPRHPFFRTLIHSVFDPSKQITKGAFTFPDSIFRTTGPGILTRIYEQWIESNSQPPITLLNESYFSPHVNPRSGVYSVCRTMVQSMDENRTELTARESVCLALHRLGYERSDAGFVTNLTVAIHQFTHLGYRDQSAAGFHALKRFPRVLTFTNICLQYNGKLIAN